MKRYFLRKQIFVLIFSSICINLYPQNFAEQTGISLAGVTNSSVAWGDYDNDGDLDILLTGSDNSNQSVSKIYQNNNGVFTDINAGLTGFRYGSVAWGDYDNDGDLDIILTGQSNSGGVSKIYRNNGGNTFSEQTTIFIPEIFSSSIAWGDYNNDGNLDILLTGKSGSAPVSRIYRNNGNNTFTEQNNIVLSGVFQSSVTWGDYDNDGDLDILMTGYSSSGIISKIYQNNGDNSFTEKTGIVLTGVYQSSVAWGDYDNDGDLDILLTGSSGPSLDAVSKIYRNDNGTFTDINAGLTGVSGSSAAWSDFNNDGNLDIIITGNSNSGFTSKVYSNKGNNIFTEMTGINLAGVSSGSVALGDYDNDGDLDILLTGQSGTGNISKIYSNISTQTNIKPSPPSNLQAVTNNGNVTFTWNKPLDIETQQNGLTYNLYIYESGQSNYECPPHAFKQTDSKNGSRLVSKPGNIQWRSSGYIIRDLSPGKTYYWSVQAVDAGLQGGTFSIEKSFIMPLYRPITQASCITFNNIQANQATATWANGGGTKRAVFIKAISQGTADPVDNTTYNINSTTPGGWKCIYNGTSNSVLLTGLNHNTDYLLHVCEYNGEAGNENYLKSSTYQNPAKLNINFTGQTDIALLSEGSVAWGDYDNDGDLDILMTGYLSGKGSVSKIYRNNGDRTFTEQTGISLTGVESSSVAWGDYDNDGDLDILLSGYSKSGYITKIYKNNGNNSFTEQTGISLIGVGNGSVAWGDYDNDGDLDILLTGSYSSKQSVSKVYRNNGDNTFSEQTDIALTGVYFSSAAWGDYDKDGHLDILLTGATGDYYWKRNSISKIYRNNGDGSFSEQKSIKLIGVAGSSAAWGDYDNDGYLDIFLSGASGDGPNDNPVSKIYHNNGNNTFIEQTGIVLPGVFEGSCSWADYDNDGNIDNLLTGNNGSDYISKIYHNNGDNTFTINNGNTLIGVYNSSVTWGDYDNDGDLDISLTGSINSGDISKIFWNEIPNPNIKPSVPDGLQSFWKNDSIIFKWNKSSDNTTPVGAITYNLRIGISSGGNDIKPAQSLPTGKLLLAEMNNLIQDTWIALKLPLKRYYWSVQAVDNGESGSSFAPESITPLDSIQAKNLQAFIKPNNSMLIRWKNGNGLRRALFGRLSSSSPNANPINRTNYHAEQYFGKGDKIGSTDWYCMYNGIADSAVIFGINAGYSYDIQVVEYVEINKQPIYFRTPGNANPGIFSSSLFSEQTSIVLPPASSVAWGDYDNDGDLDFLLTGGYNYTNISKIYRNNSDNSFTEQTSISLPVVSLPAVAWGDYDNDGDLDILLTGRDNKSIPISKIFRNDGNNTFSEQTGIVLYGVEFGSVAWGDYDNDAYLDLIMTGENSSGQVISKIYRNNRDNSFIEQTNIALTGSISYSLIWGDYDNDGYLDILLNCLNNSKIYHNTGNNSFTEQNGIVLTTGRSAAWGDYDNDGYLDLLIDTKVYHNNSNNSFTEQTGISLPEMNVVSEAWGDYNNDGDLDILMTGSTSAGGISKIYRNNGDNSFTEQTGIDFKGAYFSSSSWGDYDNDGDLDIILAGPEMSKIYRNNIIMKAGNHSANNKPSAPEKLQATFYPDYTKLAWAPVKTDETPFKSMTYNVRVGTSTGKSDVLPCQSNSANGYRQVVSMGNAQLDTTFIIKKIPSGKYYFSVQAVDQGYKGGTWSAEKSFEVRNVQAFYTADTVCLGLDTHFKNQSVATDGIASWKWDFKDGKNSSLPDPVHLYAASGSYNVKLVITSTGGVKDSLEKNIIIKPKPVTNFSASDVCQGTETVLTNLTNSSGLNITSWSWDYGDGKGSTLENPVSHGYLTTGDYQLTLKANADNGCSGSVLKTVTVAAYPVAVITANAPLSFCDRDSVVLSVGSNPQYNYKWMLNNTGITNATTNNYTAKGSGNYTVEVTNTKGLCKTTSSQVVVTKFAMPAKPAIVTLNYQEGKCPGENQIVLSVDQPVNEYTYQWKRNGSPISIANGGSHIDILSAGDYSVSANLSGCKTESAVKTIIYENAPPKPLIYIHGPNVWYLACNFNTAEYKYKWYYNSNIIPGADKYIYVANRNLGNYYVTIENTKGCYSASDVIKIPVDKLSVEDTDPFAGLKIYPNPSPGQFVVEMENLVYGEFVISVSAQGGRQVLSTKLRKTDEHFSDKVDLTGQPRGLYIINLKTERYVATRKLVVE